MGLFKEEDSGVIHAFLTRESKEYNWSITGEEGRLAYVKKLLESLDNYENPDGFNYVHIQSLTNMGLLSSELVLTPSKWKPGIHLYCYLPPSPKGSIGFHRARPETVYHET